MGIITSAKILTDASPTMNSPTVTQGLPTNLQKALDDLAKSNSFLLKPKEEQLSEQQTTPAQTANNLRPPATPAMNPGRQNISSPQVLPPGKRVSFNEAYGQRPRPT